MLQKGTLSPPGRKLHSNYGREGKSFTSQSARTRESCRVSGELIPLFLEVWGVGVENNEDGVFENRWDYQRIAIEER